MSYEFSSIADTASSVALEVMNKILEKNKYQPSKTSDWIDAIGSDVITEMRKVSPNFKYIISCIISQKVGSGLHYESVIFNYFYLNIIFISILI
jgi:hypothetical protein